MKIILQFLFVLASAGLAWAQTQIVVPGGLENVEGNSSVAEPFNSTSFRVQQVFDASQFAIPAGMVARIDGISFRIDGASTEDVVLFFGGSSISLSTTLRGPDELSPVFVDNRGADATSIYHGGLSLGGVVQPGASPQPFHETILSFGAGTFFYDPSRGNLLLEVRGGSGQAFLPGALDGHSIVGDPISWVYANSESASSGTAGTFGLVTRFDITVIPEPSAWLLAVMGLGIAAIFKRR